MVRFDLAVPTDVRFGAGRVSEVPQALVELGANRVMVITGRTTSRADAIRSTLNEAGISTMVFGVAAEPSIERVRAAVALLAEAGCDAVLGFGGGSALDVAKAAAVLATSGSDPMDHLEVIGAGSRIERAGLPCVAVPTTAGTGSEVTRNSVLSGGGVKASLRSPLLLPKVALVDPDLLVGVPKPTIAAKRHGCVIPADRAAAVTARQPVHRRVGSGWDPPLRPITGSRVPGGNGRRRRTRGPCACQPVRRRVPGQFWAGRRPRVARRSSRRPTLCAAWRGLRGCSCRGHGRQSRASRERAPGHPALRRMDEVAALLTDRPDATPEDAIVWLEELTSALSIPGLASYGLDQDQISAVVAAAQKASSMRGNPIALSDEEVGEIVAGSL